MTVGTKTALTRSASRWIGARVPCAARMSATMRASVVSRPTAETWYENAPALFSAPPITLSPGPLSTGSDSPVTSDSLTALVPWTITPSTGMRSPGRTMTVSPTRTASSGISNSAPWRSTRACAGRSAMSARSAVAVWRVARASRAFPASTSAMMNTTAS